MKYLVTGTIKHDGQLLKPGSVVEFDPAEGDRLLRDGYLSAAPIDADSDGGKKAKK
jgi:hypothetical protein